MAKLNHNPGEIDDGFAEGTYPFQIKEVELRNDNPDESNRGPFNSGNHGFTITVEFYSDFGAFNSWENFVFVPKALYKMRELCNAIGADFDDPDLDTKDFIGKRGTAELRRKEDSKYLEVDHWIALPEESEASVAPAKKTRKKSAKSAKAAKVVSEDVVPF